MVLDEPVNEAVLQEMVSSNSYSRLISNRTCYYSRIAKQKKRKMKRIDDIDDIGMW
jgi:hypothetical protein